MSAPWQAVVSASGPHCGRGSALGPDTDRRTAWWRLRLACGHDTERTVKYGRDPNDPRPGKGRVRHRSIQDVLPAPKKVRCEQCGYALQKEVST